MYRLLKERELERQGEDKISLDIKIKNLLLEKETDINMGQKI